MDRMTALPMAQNKAGHTVLTVIGSVLCVLLVPILVVNCVLIWQMHKDPSSVPRFGGFVPLVIQTDALYPEIQSGDLIVCRTAAPETLREGDIVAFVTASTAEGISVGINRIADVASKDGAPVIHVNEGENEAGESTTREISTENLVGVYRRRFSGLGDFALFMQTTQGLVLCVFLPILLLISYDVLRTRLDEKRSREETDRLSAELELFRKAQYRA